jgi:hypothetical protein
MKSTNGCLVLILPWLVGARSRPTQKRQLADSNKISNNDEDIQHPLSQINQDTDAEVKTSFPSAISSANMSWLVVGDQVAGGIEHNVTLENVDEPIQN